MKKIGLLIFILIGIGFVDATQGLLTSVDFSVEPIHAYKLDKGDGISFIFKDKEYVISVDDIGKTTARIKSFHYNEANEREVFYIPLTGQYSYKLDFDKDNFYDMKVGLAKIDEQGSAIIVFERINEASKIANNQTNSTNGITSAATAISNINLKGFAITALIVIAGIIAYFTFRKK